MSDKRLSDLNQVSSLTDNLRVAVYDPDESLAANQNKTAEISSHFDARYIRSTNVIRDSGTTLSISSVAKYVFTGSSAATWTLPVGSSSITGREFWFVNTGTANVTIQGAGADTILNSDPFIMYPGQILTGFWDGTEWILK